jgi:hypothetical protein
MANLQAVLSYEDAIASFLANRNYRSTGSTTEAQSVLAACDVLLILRPQRMQAGGPSGEQLQFDANAVLAVRNDADKWLKSQTAKTYHESQNIGYINTEYIQE